MSFQAKQIERVNTVKEGKNEQTQALSLFINRDHCLVGKDMQVNPNKVYGAVLDQCRKQDLFKARQAERNSKSGNAMGIHLFLLVALLVFSHVV